ncbi:MAG: CDP-alcohol phosphatidyltransferase family protein [Eggerthellaceae bacterium]|nr:CDP-alcohol phosphatidyltransferase family protein [Eggerthellaceae bacterium]
MPGSHCEVEGQVVAEEKQQETQAAEEVTDKVLTAANVISFIRLCMAPVALGLLLSGQDIAATVLFAVSAATDFVDGQVARRTHTVSKVGQLLDPAVDRLLMICGVVGLLAIGRLPVWIVVVVLARDVFLLVMGAWLLREHGIRVPVVYPGKVATTLLFVGFAGMMLNMPQISGLGICDFAWLPGFNSVSCSWGIWCIYIGLCLALGTTVYYVLVAHRKLKEALAAKNNG